MTTENVLLLRDNSFKKPQFILEEKYNSAGYINS